MRIEAEWTTPNTTRYSVSRGWSQRRESSIPEAGNAPQCSPAQANHIRVMTFSEMILCEIDSNQGEFNLATLERMLMEPGHLDD